MGPLGNGIRDAARLIVEADPTTVQITLRTLEVAGLATLIAAACAVPLGAATGGFRFPGQRVLSVLLNAGLALPPIAIGQILWILMWPDSRWGGGLLAGLGWLYTLNAVVLAQTLLALPVIAAITASAVRAVPAGVADQARAFGASRFNIAILLIREARQGATAALIAGLGTAMATVGAILVVGTSLGNATLASATVTQWNAGGNDARAIACGTILLLLFGVLAGLLTFVQRGGLRWLMLRPS